MQNIKFEYSYRALSKVFDSDQPVYKYPNAKVVVLNDVLANELGMNFNESSQNERVERNKEIDDIYRQFYFSKLIEFIKKINKENSQTKEAKHNPLLIG